jgi:ribosomal protein S18 acetylase RimI-like enzyme
MEPVHFTIRRFQADDFSTLLRIDHSCFAPGIAYTPFELKTYIYRPNSFTLIAERSLAGVSPLREDVRQEKPSILGFIVAECKRAAGHIITIDIRAESRRHRVGSVLLSSAEDQLRLWNCRAVRLETAVDNVSALMFYKRHSYSVVRTIPRYYSTGLDALLLEKNLLSPPSAS